MRINFELRDLRIFLSIVDCGSFQKASQAQNISQPALSRRVQAFEQRLGYPLFERTTRRISLTMEGRKFEPVARRLLEELDASIAFIGEAGEEQSGQVTISSIPSAVVCFLPRVAKKFNQRFPYVRLRILDRTTQEALDSVIHGEVDFGINLVGATETDVVFTPIMEDPFVFACHREHALADLERLTWGDLEGNHLIRVGRSQSGNRVVLDNALARANVHLNWHFEVNNLSTALALVEAGLAASVLPRLATHQSSRNAVITKPIGGPTVSRTLGIVERRTGRLSAAASFLRELLISTGTAEAR